MVPIKTEEEIEIIRKNCVLLADTVCEMAKKLKPGVTTKYLNDLADEYIRDHGAYPSFKNYHGYPFACTMSVNDAVVHGFPTTDVLKDGDVVSIDLGVYNHSFHSDSAYTFGIGKVSDEIRKLLKVTKEALYLGIEKAVAGNRVGDIAHAIQDYTERKNGYGVVRELVGHGVGRDLHEEPQVPNYGKRGSGPKLQEGMVIAIEPMINMGKKDVYNDKDGWTIRTKDKMPSAHYEHTVCVRKNKAEILSSFEKIEAVERANSNLFNG